MDQTLLTADTRTELRTGAARRLRRAGKIPAIMYGHSGTSALTLDAHDFQAKFRGVSENTIINLSIGSNSYDVLVKDFQEDILTGSILHVDFYEIEAGKALRTQIPVNIIGIPLGVREGGILEHLLYTLEVECLPKDIPEKFDIDVEELDIGDSVHVRDIEIPSEVRLLSSEDLVIVSITTPRAEIEEEEEVLEGEELEEGEEGEEGEVEGEEEETAEE